MSMITVEDIKLIARLISEVEHEYYNEPYDRIPWAEEYPDPVEKEVVKRFNETKCKKK